MVVARGGAGVEVIGDAEGREVLRDHPVVLVGELLRGQAGLVGCYQDRRAVLVRPGDHEHVVSGHPHVSAEDVGGHAETGNVADVRSERRRVGKEGGSKGRYRWGAESTKK